MDRILEDTLNHLISSIYEKDTEKVNLIYNNLTNGKETNYKQVTLGTVNALIYATFENKWDERCKDIFKENFSKILSGELDSSLFENYFGVVEEKDNLQNDYINKALDYIEENIDQPLTLEALASKLHISKNYFSNLFKKVTGIRFCKYVNYRRIEHAKVLLKESDYTLSEIAEKSGYNSQSHFSTTFLQFEKISPGVYRYSVK